MRFLSRVVSTVLLLLGVLLGCEPPRRGTTAVSPTSPPTPPPPPAQAPDQITQNLPAAKQEEPKKFPLDQDQFKAAVSGSTRDQLLAKYGPSDEVGDWGAAVGWDGPVSIYRGPFTSADGKKAKARLYFRESGGSSVVASVEFVNQ